MAEATGATRPGSSATAHNGSLTDLSLTFIGVGNAFASGGVCWNGFLANRRILFETPPQALMSVQRACIEPNDIDTVLISHHHGDHFYGLPMLMLWWKWMGRTTPLYVIGPPRTDEITRDIARETFPWLFDLPYELNWIEAVPGEPIELPGLRITPVEVVHDESLNICLGFACEIAGHRLGYTGDTVYCPGVETLARWSEVLVCECASVAPNPVHMNLIDDIPRVRALLPRESHMILTHIDKEVAVAAPPQGTVIAKDQETYTF